jgi:hypothetical protein
MLAAARKAAALLSVAAIEKRLVISKNPSSLSFHNSGWNNNGMNPTVLRGLKSFARSSKVLSLLPIDWGRAQLASSNNGTAKAHESTALIIA